VDVVTHIHRSGRREWQHNGAMVDHQLHIRPATLADVPIMRSLFVAYDNDGPAPTLDVVGPYLGHLVEHAKVRVTERDGEVVAFGAVIDTGNAHHLADLFVRQDLLGQGIGWPLLKAVLGTAQPRTTFASADPRALPLYVRAGMTPLWPCLYLEGSIERLPVLDRPFPIEPAEHRRLAELERAWTGADRPLDHAFWAAQAEAEGFVIVDAGQPVAFAYARAHQLGAARIIDRLLVQPGTAPLAPTLAAIRHAGRDSTITVTVLGPNPILPILLEAGFRIFDRDQFMASDPDLIDPIRLLPNPGMV
jgi:GNAT superfamily N-acetyltransferase